MLFLRRSAGQSLTFIRDGKVAAKATFTRIDIDTGEIDVKLELELTPAMTKLCTLRQGAETIFLQGAVRLKFSFIMESEDYPDAASIGLQAPQSILIYRSERLIGLGPDQIAALRKRKKKNLARQHKIN